MIKFNLVLLLLVTRKNPDLFDIRIKKTFQHGIAERTRTSCNQQDFVFKHGHILLYYFYDIINYTD